MAKDRSESDAREKKEKKDKKRKHSETDEGAKREKKEKKRKSTQAGEPGPVVVDEDGDVLIAQDIPVVKDEDDVDDHKATVKIDLPLAALVPFANPLCDEKSQKKVLKGVKKAAKNKTLKRGVKECVKAIRKSPVATPATLSLTSTTLPPGIVVLAADISPMDVISHIPVLCEDHNIPYVYVPSRADLGAAGSTKRPTSVVMMMPRVKKGADEGGAEWEEAYRELYKLALKLGQVVKV